MLLSEHKLICYKNDQFRTTFESASELFDLAHHSFRIAKHDAFLQKFYLIDDNDANNTFTFIAPSELDRAFWVYQIRIHMTWSKADEVRIDEEEHDYEEEERKMDICIRRGPHRRRGARLRRGRE